LRYTIIFAILLFSLTGLILTHVDAESDKIMPDWFKNNAKWWNEGLITDSDMINALENLMIQNVIPLDKFVKSSSGTEPQADVQKDGGVIPSYQKNVFGFWSDGIVSDDEIVNSVGFLMNKGIINSDKIQKEITARKEKLESFGRPDSTDARNTNPGTYHVIDSNVILSIYKTAKQNEVSMTYLQKIKAAEYEIVKNLHNVAVSDYSKKKDQDSMNVMVSLGDAEKIAKNNSDLSLQIQKRSVQLAEEAKNVAIKSGLDVWDLDEAVVDQQSEIDSMSGYFKTDSELKSAYKDAQKSQIKANEILQNSLQSVISNVPSQQLSFVSKNLILDKLSTIDYSNVVISHPCPVQSSLAGFPANLILGIKIQQAFGDDENTSNVPCKSNSNRPLGDIITLNENGELIVFLIDIISKENGASEVLQYLFPGMSKNDDSESVSTVNSNDVNSTQSGVDSVFPDLPLIGTAGFGLSLDPDSSSGVDSVIPELGDSIVGAGFGLVLAPEIIQGHNLLHETVDLKTGQTEGYSSTDRCGVCGEFGYDPKNPLCQYCGSEFAPLVEDNTCSACGGEIGENGTCSACGTNWGTEVPEDGVCIRCGEVIKDDDKKTIDNSDGTEILTLPDGTKIFTYTDGLKVFILPDGTKVFIYSDGAKFFKYTDGLKVFISPDGTKITTDPDGTETSTSPDTSSSETTNETTTSNGPYNPNQSYSIPIVIADYGRQYPAYQFTIVQYSNVCNGEAFYIGNGPFVGATTLSLGGYAPVGNCGFGTVNKYPIQNISIAGSILNDYLNHVGLKLLPSVPTDTTGQSSSTTNANTAPNTGSEYTMHARIINGKAYPAYQFLIFSAYSGCSESYLGVSPYGWKNSAGQLTVYHIDFDSVGLVKPTPVGCGFGKVSSTSYVEEYPISSSQADDWKKRFGLSVTNP